MKRLIALAALLVAASACATTTNTNEGANTNANANANAAATATPAGVTQADLEAKERQVWDALKAKNWDAFAGFLADDLTYVAGDGVYDKAKMTDTIKKYDLTEYSFSDIKFVKVDDDLAVLAYTSTEKSTYDGKPSDGKPLYNASAWANRGGKWVAVYHQETHSMEMPAGAGANTNANASSSATHANTNMNANTSGANMNASASPSSSPAAAPSTPIDAEKAVWDALKSKNYDAFAAFLASDSLEVEPDGIHDKSGSIEGVKHFDTSKFKQSDYKETKLDSDSALVSYVVKGPGPKGQTETMRHSTVWNNRGGQWKAYFHQGTMATK